MCLHLPCIMALMIEYEGLGLFIARGTHYAIKLFTRNEKQLQTSTDQASRVWLLCQPPFNSDNNNNKNFHLSEKFFTFSLTKGSISTLLRGSMLVSLLIIICFCNVDLDFPAVILHDFSQAEMMLIGQFFAFGSPSLLIFCNTLECRIIEGCAVSVVTRIP